MTNKTWNEQDFEKKKSPKRKTRVVRSSWKCWVTCHRQVRCYLLLFAKVRVVSRLLHMRSTISDIKAPENVLFLCKLNSITEDEDLELIFSRFDPNVKVEIIRDHDTGASLGYAFAEFNTKQKCVETYFKMNGALVDDRRIKVDFSQSVVKIWDRYNQKLKPQQLGPDALGGGRGGGQSANRGRRGRGGGARGSFDGSSRQNGR